MSDNTRGALLMMGSMAAFVTNDTLIKLVSTDMSLFQAIFVRGILATILIGALAWRQHAVLYRPHKSDRHLITLRTLGEMGATVCFLTALFNMPLANATAILQSMPLAITLAAALFLKAPVGWRRYTAITIGFIGVLIIIRPGAAGFNSYSLLALAAVGFIVLRDLATHRLSRAVPSLHVAFIASLAIMLMGGMVTAVTGDWSPMSPVTMVRLAGTALCLFAGYLLGVMTMRVGEISFVTPFRYTILIWAIILGVVVFGDIPDRWTLLGTGIIVSTGLFTIFRERKRRTETATGQATHQHADGA